MKAGDRTRKRTATGSSKVVFVAILALGTQAYGRSHAAAGNPTESGPAELEPAVTVTVYKYAAVPRADPPQGRGGNGENLQ